MDSFLHVLATLLTLFFSLSMGRLSCDVTLEMPGLRLAHAEQLAGDETHRISPARTGSNR